MTASIAVISVLGAMVRLVYWYQHFKATRCLYLQGATALLF